MDQKKEWEALMNEYKNIKIPEKGLKAMEETIERAKKENAEEMKKEKKRKKFQKIGGCVAAALVIAVILPNMNANVAMAMEKIPVLGQLIRVVTFGRYDFEDEDHEAKVEIPKVEVEEVETAPENPADIKIDEGTAGTKPQSQVKQSADSLNEDIQNYINPIVEEFESTLSQEMKQALDISYDVVTNSDSWFTLRINVLEIQASGYQYYKYYHINKLTGERASLGDIFRPDADYITPISEEIKKQMRERMAAGEGEIFFLDDEEMPQTNFEKIKPDQNFYFNENGEIVIPFDEYEVAPGYMGNPEFVIPKEVTDSIRI